MIGLVAVHLRHLRLHPGRAMLSVIGIAAGTTLVVAMLGLFSSLTSSVDRLVTAAGKADLQVVNAGGAPVPEDVAARIGGVDGVAAAVPVVRTVVVLEGQRVLLLGADERAQALGARITPSCLRPSSGVAAGSSPPVALGPALARRLGPKRTLSLYNGAATVPVQVAGTIACGGVSAINDGWFAIAPLPDAESLAGRARMVDAILVRGRPGVSRATLSTRIRPVAGAGLSVQSPQQAVAEARDEIAIFQQGTVLIVALALVVGGFLVFNTMSMAALERRRELATLRALGGRRRTLLAGVLGEAAVLGLAGSIGGAVLGVLAGRAAIGSVPGVLADAIGVRPTFTISAPALAAGVAIGTVATILAALLPARAATAVAPVDAMRPEGVLEAGAPATVAPLPLVVGTVVFVGGVAGSLSGNGPFATVGFVALTAGFIVATAGLMGPISTAAAAVAGRLGGAGRLAGAGLERSPRRVWATTMAVVVGVGTVVTFRGTAQNEFDTFARQIASLGRPDLWALTSPPESISTDVRMPREWIGRVAAVPGVEQVRAGQAMYATIEGRRVLLEGVQSNPSEPLVAALTPAARAEVVSGAAVSVSRAFAGVHHLAAGDFFDLPTVTGPERVRVAGVADVLLTVPAGGIGMALDQLERRYDRPGASWLAVHERPGADPVAVRRQVATLMRDAGFPTWLVSGSELVNASRRSLNQSADLLLVMQWVVVGATALAVLNTLLISVVERRREVGILRAVGTTRRTVRRMISTEALAIGAVGAVLGVGFGLMGHRLTIAAVERLTTFRVTYDFLILPIVLAGAVAGAIAVLGSLVPAWRASRVNLIEAIGYE